MLFIQTKRTSPVLLYYVTGQCSPPQYGGDLTYDPKANAASMCVRLWFELGEFQMTVPQADAEGLRCVTSIGVCVRGIGVIAMKTPIHCVFRSGARSPDNELYIIT